MFETFGSKTEENFSEERKKNYLRGKQAPLKLSEGEIKIILREFIISLKVKLKLIANTHTHTRERKKCKLFEIRRG